MSDVLRTPPSQTTAAGVQPRVGFFTDTSVCIGCKACEVACKEWNGVPETELRFTGDSYDNTSALGADAWRHVAFIEQRRPAAGLPAAAPGRVSPAAATQATATPDSAVPGTATQHAVAPGTVAQGAATPGSATPGAGGSATAAGPARPDLRWLMSSDVCKHCTRAACLEVCPTGALFRTEFGTVVVQEDVCNGCGYCVPACPFGVIDQRGGDGRVWKCTLCYDRLRDGLEPACAKACPTDSIQFGPLEELRVRAADRLEVVRGRGEAGAQLYGADPDDGVGGAGAFFLLLDDPEVYGLPPDPVVTTRDVRSMWAAAGAAGSTLAAVVALAVLGGRR